MTGHEIVTEARSWIGTPYRHQASLKGVGCDCLGLVRGVWRRFHGAEPEALPSYAPDWGEAFGDDALLDGMRRHFIPRPVSAAQAGDVLVFRMAVGSPAKHCAIASGNDTLIHAYWGRSVVETRLVTWWLRRAVAAFSFPIIED